MEKSTTSLRVCSSCRVEKPLEAFAKASWCKDGRRSKCQACRSSHRPPPDDKVCTGCRVIKPISGFQRRSGAPDGYQQRCKECISAYKKSRWPVDRDQSLAAHAQWYIANRESAIAKVLEYQAANQPLRRHWEGKRRARIAANRVGDVDVAALWTGDCGICDRPIDPDLTYPDPMSRSLDHVIPISLGGSHEQSNLQWSHLRCNVRKGARLSA